MKIKLYNFLGQGGRFVSETDFVRVEAERDQLQRLLNERDEEVDRLRAVEAAAKEMLRIAGIANQGSNAYNRAITHLHQTLEKMVTVPLQWAQQTVSAGPGEYLSRSDIDLLSEALNQAAQQVQGEPVEIDERAEFEAWAAAKWNLKVSSVQGVRYGSQYSPLEIDAAWSGWQARAALERKP